MLKLSIIGAGRVGQTFGRLFADSKLFQIDAVCNQSIESAQKAVEFIGQGRVVGLLHELSESDVYLIATSDSQISAIAKALTESVDLTGKIVFHCSGALSSTELGYGDFHKASIHPVKSFADPRLAINDFAGTYCGVEGDQEALVILKPIFEQLGGNCFDIASEMKQVYHAGAVFASNFLPLLVEASLKCYAKSGVNRDVAKQIIEPIIRLTLENSLKLEPKTALTGPVARGDYQAVERQFQSLQENLPELAELYDLLSENLSNLLLK
jgi:predicted short-subunit dehydrogenase-like oxidoreductase (DUF2520 family)